MNTSEKNIIKSIRKDIVDMVYQAQEGHIPSAFSIVEILYVLYKYILKYDSNNPKNENRDFFILSKGHSGTALYAILSHFNFFERSKLFSYCKPNSILGGHPDRNKVPGVEASTGSLGHGLPIALGLALSLKILDKPNKVFVLIGDGESEEGTVWESTMLARNLSLDNLIVIMDNNSSQSYSSGFNYKNIWQSFGWLSVEIDGHNLENIIDAFNEMIESTETKSKSIIANTIKGKGVSFIENNPEWHHKSPSVNEYNKIMEELK